MLISPPDLPALPVGWYNLADRVPRRDQAVRILTQRGTDHRAQFVVAYTDAWPSGASWLLPSHDALPFADVLMWSPDPDAMPPRGIGPAQADEGPESTSPRPAILNEVIIEVERTGTLLLLLPTDHLDWSPHADIPTLRVLSWRLVRLVARIGWILELDKLDVDLEPEIDVEGGIAEAYEANEEGVRAAVVRLGAEAMRASWRLERGGQAVARLPRGDALRTFGLTPLVYYRGQLAELLTALGVDVPTPSPLWPFREGGAR